MTTRRNIAAVLGGLVLTLAALMGYSEYKNRTLTAKQIAGVQGKIEGLDTKIEGLDTKIEGLDTKIEGLETNLKSTMEKVTEASCNLDWLYREESSEKIDKIFNANEIARVELTEKKAAYERLEKAADRLAQKNPTGDLPEIELEDDKSKETALEVSVSFQDPYAGFNGAGACELQTNYRLHSYGFPFRGWQDVAVHADAVFKETRKDLAKKHGVCTETKAEKDPPTQVAIMICKTKATTSAQMGFLMEFLNEIDLRDAVRKSLNDNLATGADVRELGAWAARAAGVRVLVWNESERLAAHEELSAFWSASNIDYAATKKVIEETAGKDNDFAIDPATYKKALMYRRYVNAFTFEGVEEKDYPRVYAEMRTAFRWSIAEVGEAVGHPSTASWRAKVAAESAPKAEAEARLEAKADLKAAGDKK